MPLDNDMYDEVLVNYKNIIKTYSEKFELFTRVLYDYNNFESKKINREKQLEYISARWENYKSELSLENSDQEIEKALVQVILFSILKGRRRINKIKERVKL